jgi:hypothetical protein
MACTEVAPVAHLARPGRPDRDRSIRAALVFTLTLSAGCPRTETPLPAGGDGGTPRGGDGSAAPDTPLAKAALCDGSEDVRLLYVNRGGGPLEPAFSFYGAYGHEFFVITGRCQYWAGASGLSGIRSGTLDVAAADGIARKLHHADFASLPASSGQSCPDASVRGLSDGTRTVLCHCTCPTDGPPAVRETFTNLRAIQEQLVAGPAAELPIRVLAYATDDKPGSNDRSLSWPLSWSPAQVLADGQTAPAPDAGRLVSPVAELAALRTLRTTAMQQSMYNAVRVKTGTNEIYRVYLRDEAPAAVARALDRVRF